MPVLSNTNNRVLPANARAADVAASTVDRLTAVQRERYHNAFIVQGYEAVLYQRLTSGLSCACRSKTKAIQTRLDEKGNAHEGFLSELLTGGLQFGVSSYGTQPAGGPTDNDPDAPYGKLFSIDERAIVGTNQQATSAGGAPTLGIAGINDRFSKNGPDDLGTTLIDSGVGPTGPVSDFEYEDVNLSGIDGMYFGGTDTACPVCFGSGFVGGFSLFSGWRQVLNFQHPGMSVGSGLIDTERPVPSITTDRATFLITLPRYGLHVDALRVWNFNRVVPASVVIDGVTLARERDLLNHCDGKPHTLEVVFAGDGEFTHVELQVATSLKQPYLEFPKLSKAAVQTVFESLQDFSLVVSPIVPVLRPNDFIADAVYGKVLQVKSTNHWNDRRNTVLGWECEVRAVQPQELTNLLPRRRLRVLNQPRTTPRVRDNITGPRRT